MTLEQPLGSPRATCGEHWYVEPTKVSKRQQPREGWLQARTLQVLDSFCLGSTVEESIVGLWILVANRMNSKEEFGREIPEIFLRCSMMPTSAYRSRFWFTLMQERKWSLLAEKSSPCEDVAMLMSTRPRRDHVELPEPYIFFSFPPICRAKIGREKMQYFSRQFSDVEKHQKRHRSDQ